MRKNILSFISAAVVVATAIHLTSCSSTPRMVVDVVEHLPSLSPDSVRIYDTDQHMPQGARPIGKVDVMGGDMTPADKCRYINMLSLAVRKTADCGANALHVDGDRKFGLTSNCHRVWGTMYVLPDGVLTGDTPFTLAQMEERKDQKLLEQVALKQAVSQDAQNPDSKRKVVYGGPLNILKVNAGPSWMVSELALSSSQSFKNESGFGLDVDFQHLWQSGLGFGINYLYHYVSLASSSYNYKLHYIGPSIVASYMLGSRVRTDAAVGLGYSVFSEVMARNGSRQESGLGILTQLGIEVMVVKNVGVGFQLNTYTMKLKRPENINTDRFSFYGIRHIDALLGLRFYL